MSSGMSPRSDDKRAAPATVLAQDLAAVLGKLKRRLREQAHVGDLTPSQASTLLRLERDGPATASSLARAEGMRPQSMGAVVAALEAAGMVRGAPDPNDGRQPKSSVLIVGNGGGARGAAGLVVGRHPGAAFAAGTGRRRGGGRAAQTARRRLTD